MSEEILINIEGISKKFCKDLKTSLRYGLADSVKAIFSNGSQNRELRSKEFWAIKDVSFQLKRGECIGLVGHNGAGKSTLLKLINGLIKPDGGKIQVRGKVGALIELGAGFNPILTGRENVYNNAAILGYTRKEIDSKLNEIIEFSEIEEFIDMPVQNYSSGMKVRLGFSVAAHLEPDVMLIDEVLAVGDLGFRIKCMNKIGEMLNQCAVIFVSHSMPQIARVCTSGLLLSKGRVKHISDNPAEIISEYYKVFSVEEERILGKSNVELQRIKAFSKDKEILTNSTINQTDPLKFEIDIKLLKLARELSFKIFFINNDARNVLDIASEINNNNFVVDKSRLTISLEVDNLHLNGGKYAVTLVIIDEEHNERLYRHDSIFELTVYANYQSWSDNVAYGSWKIA